jgi:hypothetical protein
MRITRNKLRQIIQEELGRIHEGEFDPEPCDTDTISMGPFFREEEFTSAEEAQRRLEYERETYYTHITAPPPVWHNTFGCQKLKFIECLEKLIEDDVWPAKCQVASDWS